MAVQTAERKIHSVRLDDLDRFSSKSPCCLSTSPKHNTATAPYMASRHRSHFADPHHPLQETQYSHGQTGHCSFCLLKLAGHRGYGCFCCNIHLHGACAGHFVAAISFFAHPSHALKLSRSPGRVLCDICRGDCPKGSFAYRCVGCGFDAHPPCAMLPERAPNPFHPGHELRMVSTEAPGGRCSACHHALPKWRYIGSSFELHIACAIDPPAGGGQGSNGHAPASFQGSYDAQGSHGGAVGQRSFGGPAAAAQGWYQYHGPVAPAGYNQAIQGYGGPAGQGSCYGSPAVIQGGYGYGPPVQGCYYPAAMPKSGGYYGATGSSGQSTVHNPGSGLMIAIAKFLFGITINTAVSDFASQLLFGG